MRAFLSIAAVLAAFLLPTAFAGGGPIGTLPDAGEADSKPISSLDHKINPGETHRPQPNAPEATNDPTSTNQVLVYRHHNGEGVEDDTFLFVVRPGVTADVDDLETGHGAGFLPGSTGTVDGTGGRVIVYPGATVTVTNTGTPPGGDSILVEIQRPWPDNGPPATVEVPAGSTVTIGG
jgi:hypothetical protein